MPEAEVEAVEDPLAVEGPLDRSRAFVIENVQHPAEVLEEVRRWIAEDPFDGWAHVVEMRGRLESEMPHDIGRLVREVAIALLDGGQGGLRVVPIGDITPDGENFGALTVGDVSVDPLEPPLLCAVGSAFDLVVQDWGRRTQKFQLTGETDALVVGQESIEWQAHGVGRSDVVLRCPRRVVVRR